MSDLVVTIESSESFAEFRASLAAQGYTTKCGRGSRGGVTKYIILKTISPEGEEISTADWRLAKSYNNTPLAEVLANCVIHTMVGHKGLTPVRYNLIGKPGVEITVEDWAE